MNAVRSLIVLVLLPWSTPLARAANLPAGPKLSADEALTRLVAGNARVRAAAVTHPNQESARRADTATNGQRPFAVILSCADSRVPPELLFDQGIGDLFVIRVAGNVAGVDETASIEYAVGPLGVPLCVVMGHARCGAVQAAVDGTQLTGSLPELVGAIAPAAARARRDHPALTGSPLLAAAVECNVWLSMENLFQRSAAVRERVASGQLRVVGAIYDLASGDVRWLGPHPEQARLLATESRAP